MRNTMPKTINLLLEDGTLNGVMCIEESAWNSGELYSAPRESINKLLSTEACNKFGVYLLLSDEMVYVGQSMDLATRIKQHLAGKSWWKRVIVLTTKDDSLNRSDIDYLESVLINKANENNKLDCDNKKKGNPQKVTKFRKVDLEQYLDEAFLLMELIGVTVFTQERSMRKKESKLNKQENIKEIDHMVLDVQGKTDAKELLAKNGIIIEAEFNYARRQKNRAEYWVNPKVTVVDEAWDLILNNQFTREITYIHIPAKTFALNKGGEGLFARKDKPIYIDLNILVETLCDRRSGYDFSPYVVKKLHYGS